MDGKGSFGETPTPPKLNVKAASAETVEDVARRYQTTTITTLHCADDCEEEECTTDRLRVKILPFVGGFGSGFPCLKTVSARFHPVHESLRLQFSCEPDDDGA
jgi:hypothetical protein